MPRPSANQDKQARREAILEATRSVLAEKGYSKTSMLEVARRASASKETLYAWFGDKQGLFEALVLSNTEEIHQALHAKIAEAGPNPKTVITAFAHALQKLLLGERALVVNRAAIAEAGRDAALGQLIGSQGRQQILPDLIDYLETQKAEGRLSFEVAEEAVDTLFGLAIGDRQVRRLLGSLPMPTEAAITLRAKRSAERFMVLYGP